MNIEELVNRAYASWEHTKGTCWTDHMRKALTEQAETHALELRAYETTVAELTRRVEALSVPVVGDAVAYLKADADGKVLWSEDCVCEDAVWAGEDSEFGEYSLPVYRKPTHSIPAAELATLREKAAEADGLRNALLALKEDCQTSNDCQYGTLSAGHVERIVDAAIAQGKGE